MSGETTAWKTVVSYPLVDGHQVARIPKYMHSKALLRNISLLEGFVG
jgi:hypothetical protein